MPDSKWLLCQQNPHCLIYYGRIRLCSTICRRMRGVLQAHEKGTIDTLWRPLHRARSIPSHPGLTGSSFGIFPAVWLNSLTLGECQFSHIGVLGAPNRVVVLQEVSTLDLQSASSLQILERFRAPELRSLDLQSVFFPCQSLSNSRYDRSQYRDERICRCTCKVPETRKSVIRFTYEMVFNPK